MTPSSSTTSFALSATSVALALALLGIAVPSCGRVGFDAPEVNADAGSADAGSADATVVRADASPVDPCGAEADDADNDGVADACDICPGFDDAEDDDGDEVPDGCDPCPKDNPDDGDGDGLCGTIGLIAFWPFEMDANDAHSGHHATLFGNAEITWDGQRGGILQVDGNGSYAEIPYDELLNPTEGFTISVWVKPRSPVPNGRQSVITTRMLMPAKGYMIFRSVNNEWEFRTGDGTADFNIIKTPIANIGQWTHLVAVYGGGKLWLYLDGALAAQAVGEAYHNYENELRIGAGNTGAVAEDFFEGMIDDVRLYDFAADDIQVQRMFEAQQGS